MGAASSLRTTLPQRWSSTTPTTLATTAAAGSDCLLVVYPCTRHGCFITAPLLHPPATTTSPGLLPRVGGRRKGHSPRRSCELRSGAHTATQSLRRNSYHRHRDSGSHALVHAAAACSDDAQHELPASNVQRQVSNILCNTSTHLPKPSTFQNRREVTVLVKNVPE